MDNRHRRAVSCAILDDAPFIGAALSLLRRESQTVSFWAALPVMTAGAYFA